jgi:hypothetical protein
MRKVFHNFLDPNPSHAGRPVIFLGTGDLAGMAARAIFIIDQ